MDSQRPPLATTSSRQLDVSLGDRSYVISVSSGGAMTFAESIANAIGDLTHVLVIADLAIDETIAAPLAEAFRQREVRVDRLAIASGETSKSIAELSRVWDWMLDHSADRRSVVVAVGGGVIGDLVGFAAATYARGLRFVQIPTTLLAMVDSSVGGKTGINLTGAKNMVGAFWQPSLVLIDTEILRTLPQREYLSGLAEVIKYGVIDDAEFFDWLEEQMPRLVDRDGDALREAITRSCQSKARVVGEDERETTGRRAILNYGHTFAHAIEATAGYGVWLHGEAVAVGMQMAAQLAVALGRTEGNLLDRQTRLLQAAGLPLHFPEADVPRMLEVMRRDKKVAHGELRFILPSRIGKVETVGKVAEAAVVNAIEATRGG